MSKVFYVGDAKIAITDRGEWVAPDIYAVIRWCNPWGGGDRIEIKRISSPTLVTESWFLYFNGNASDQFRQIMRDIQEGDIGHWKSYFKPSIPPRWWNRRSSKRRTG